jgi:hypothetical protein
MLYLKSVDIYASPTLLLTYNQANFKSAIGGIFTIITIIGLIIISFPFGFDFYFRQNPKISFQDYSLKETRFTHGADFTFTFSFFDKTDNNTFSYENNIFYSVNYEYMEKGTYLKNYEIPVEQDKSNAFFSFNLLNSSYDLGYDYSNFTIGAATLKISLCNADKTRCASPEFKKQLKNWVVMTGYAQYFYDPNNNTEGEPQFMFKTDLNVINFDPRIRRTESYYLKETYSNEDRGILFATPTQNFSWVDVVEKDREYELKDDTPEDDLIYSVSFSMESSYFYYKKNYMRMQDLAAVMGGVTSFLLIFFGCLSDIINSFIKSEMFFNDLFTYDPDVKNM